MTRWMWICAVALHAAPALAGRQEDGAALFEQAMTDLQAGRTEMACNELTRSIAAWPDSGAKGALAECQTTLGKIASAWRLWGDLAETAPGADLRDDAAANAAKLVPRLPRVTVKVHGTAPPDLKLTIDGRPFDLGASQIPIDPGPLVVVAATGDGEIWRSTVQAREGITTAIDVPIDELAHADEQHVGLGRRRLGLSVAVGGGVMVVGGLVLGMLARADWQRATSDCGGSTDHCQTDGLTRAQSDLENARSAATPATAFVLLGAAAIAAGVVLYVTAPRSDHAIRLVPTLGAASAGLVLERGL